MLDRPSAFDLIPYLDWIKRRAFLPDQEMALGLAMSGMPDADQELLRPLLTDIPLMGLNHDGWKPFEAAMAEKYQLSANQVVHALGASNANYIALSAVVGRGDRVVCEHPIYEPMLSVLEGIGCDVHLLYRKRELEWKFDEQELREAFSVPTRLFMMTNPHNPTGAWYADEQIQMMAQLAERAGAYFLIDEVYRDAVPELRGTSAIHLSRSMIITSSWTKVYGLGALRAGWILAQPDVVAATKQVVDRVTGRGAVVHEELCARIARRPDILQQCGFARLDRLEQNRLVMADLLERTGWDATLPNGSMTTFIQHPSKNGNEIEAIAKANGILVTPGRFFGVQERFRIAFTPSVSDFCALLSRFEKILT